VRKVTLNSDLTNLLSSLFDKWERLDISAVAKYGYAAVEFNEHGIYDIDATNFLSILKTMNETELYYTTIQDIKKSKSDNIMACQICINEESLQESQNVNKNFDIYFDTVYFGSRGRFFAIRKGTVQNTVYVGDREFISRIVAALDAQKGRNFQYIV